ncbi:hypothetical protein QT196_23730 [Streptomyces sp. P9-2B-2]|uniref:hypothetical protein n=1 Tax=Streptomyces sp. P9-2B-2 TaxID=3057114 RepID=UPI0025B36EB7|nr:hypothetical protein [Streptomyces sp. P9-2B-2]WJY40046.1 hypothetical protein QT196_23730 [Streptomyces sp. P9-2B-2]
MIMNFVLPIAGAALCVIISWTGAIITSRAVRSRQCAPSSQHADVMARAEAEHVKAQELAEIMERLAESARTSAREEAPVPLRLTSKEKRIFGIDSNIEVRVPHHG